MAQATREASRDSGRDIEGPGGLTLLLRGVRWRWRLLALVFAPLAALGVLYVSALPPSSTAVSVVSIVPQQADVAYGDLVTITSSRYAVAMTSTPRLRQVSRQTGVPVSELESSVNVTTTAVDANMKISATSEEPGRAVRIADAVADAAVVAGGDSQLLTVEKIAPAVLQPTPLTSSAALLLAVLLAFALALALWTVFLAERLRPRVVTEADAERITGAPTLGSVTRTRKDRDLATMPDGEGAAAQARILRTGVRATESAGRQQLTVTGVGAGVGVATTAYLLSRSFATIGQQVLLVDGDLSRSLLSNQIGFDQGVGIDRLLGGRDMLAPAGAAGELALVTAESGDLQREDVLAQGLGSVVDAGAGLWERVVVSSASLDGSGVAESGLAVTPRAVLVVTKGTSTDAVRDAARRVRRLSGELIGTVVYDGPVDL